MVSHAQPYGISISLNSVEWGEESALIQEHPEVKYIS